ncbi:hypothetical protein FSP39_019286 [Pinctada imbricata]|uniref:DDE-1 domain-containing protein n=1 Tax=Pinctada imbricata TaxID=66713 RepID=A0AA89BXP2_PINIB|nr:hypothetical protein FSP39_019286 [Pinctada imbricata]
MANLGYGYTRQELVNMAWNYAVILEKRTKTNPLTLRWFDGFISRWPELRVLKPRGLEHLRAKSARAETVHNYFSNLSEVIAKYDLADKPHLIFNVDEKGISQNHSPPHVVAGKDVHPPAVTSGKSATTTIIGCGSAAGVAVPPFFVFQGARMRSDLLDGTSPGASGEVSETGWSNALIFRKYLQQHFIKHIPRDDHHVLLLMDGHSTHVSVGLIEWAKENKIVFFILPAHTSHILQPLDVGCYGPLQRIYNNECHKQMRLTSTVITRYNVGELASRAYTRAMSPENLQTAFKRTGIFPLDVAAIDPLTLTPAEVFKPVDISAEDSQPITNNGDAPQSETRVPQKETETHLEEMEAPPKEAGAPHKEIETSNFFNNRLVSLVKVKTEKEATKKPRKCLSKIVSGQCITNDDIENFVREHIVNKTTTKAPKKITKKIPKKSKNDNSQIAGPSGMNLHVANSSNQPDDSEPMEISEDEKCCRCGKFTPDEVRKSSVIIFTKWAQCDVCGHWVHLKYCDKLIAVRRGVEFKCIHCK